MKLDKDFFQLREKGLDEHFTTRYTKKKFSWWKLIDILAGILFVAILVFCLWMLFNFVKVKNELNWYRANINEICDKK